MGTCLPRNDHTILTLPLQDREALCELHALVDKELWHIASITQKSIKGRVSRLRKHTHKDLAAIYKAYARFIQHNHLETIEPRVNWTLALLDELPTAQLFSSLFRLNCQVIRTLSQLEPCQEICCCHCKAAPSWMTCNGFLSSPPTLNNQQPQQLN